MYLSGSRRSTWALGCSWRSRFWSRLGRFDWVCPCCDGCKRYLQEHSNTPTRQRALHALLMILTVRMVSRTVYLKCQPGWKLCSPWKTTSRRRPGCPWRVRSRWNGHSCSRRPCLRAVWQVWFLISERRRGDGSRWHLKDTTIPKMQRLQACASLIHTHTLFSTWHTFDLAFWPFSLQSAASSSSDTVSSSTVLLLLKAASSLFNLFPLMRNLPFRSCTETRVYHLTSFLNELKVLWCTVMWFINMKLEIQTVIAKYREECVCWWLLVTPSQQPMTERKVLCNAQL